MQNILLVQDHSRHASAVRDALTYSGDSAFRVIWVTRFCDALDHLAGKNRQPQANEPIGAVLIDLFLPDSAGMETFDRLFQAAPQIPILILTAVQDEDTAKLAVQRGAQEYLLSDRLDAYLLPKAVRSMIERAANMEALFEEKERAQVTLDSIGDAVISTDTAGNVTYLNVVAESLTGWSKQEAAGHAFNDVFHIIDGVTRDPARNPMAFAIQSNETVGLTPNCVLIRRDGVESPIEDSAAPIHDRYGHVTGAVIVFHDVSAAHAMTLSMSYLAHHDSLTDLPNRALLNDRLTEALSLAHRYQRQLAVLYLDVDRFKHINDSLGHMIGDRLLQSIAQRLLGCVRESDTVSRQGGDEFVILLSEVAHARDATICADKILDALRAPHKIDQHEVHVTASIGIVTYPDDGLDADALMEHADFAMYHAKENGRDNRQFFKRDMNIRALERQSLENGLRHALQREELSPALPAQIEPADRYDRGCRGADPMGSPRVWVRITGRLHPHRGGIRAHRADRSLGAGRSLSPGAGVAGYRTDPYPHRNQYFRRGAANRRFRWIYEPFDHDDRIGPALLGTRIDGDLPDAGFNLHIGSPSRPQGHRPESGAR